MEIVKLEELDENIRDLIKRSLSARELSHSPYSGFPVGAALLSSNGTVFTGCNVENSSFPLTLCAETTAVAKAVSEGVRNFEAIAISAVTGNELVPPCGGCRQILCEFNPKIKIYLHNPTSPNVGITSLQFLLPQSFNPESFKLLLRK